MRDSSLRRAIRDFLGVVDVALVEARTGPLDEGNVECLRATAKILGDMIVRDDHAKLAWIAMSKDTN